MENFSMEHLTLFEGMDAGQMELLSNLFIPYKSEVGSLLFIQGDYADFLYLIVEGEIGIRYKPEDGPELTVTTVKPEGVVGWSAVLGNQTYSSSAICLKDCSMLRVGSSDLHEFCVTHPELGGIIIERLAGVIAERLRNTHHHVISLLNRGLRLRQSPAFLK